MIHRKKRRNFVTLHKQNFSLFVNYLYCSKIFLLSSSLFLTLLAVILKRVELVISSLRC